MVRAVGNEYYIGAMISNSKFIFLYGLRTIRSSGMGKVLSYFEIIGI